MIFDIKLVYCPKCGKVVGVNEEWVGLGHSDGTTSFAIRDPQAGYDEDMGNYDLIVKDWESLK